MARMDVAPAAMGFRPNVNVRSVQGFPSPRAGAVAAFPLARRPNAMAPSRITAGQRLVFLDALRGVAALEVAWFHFYWMTPLRLPLTLIVPAPIRSLWQHGALGVQVFFVLSG